MELILRIIIPLQNPFLFVDPGKSPSTFFFYPFILIYIKRWKDVYLDWRIFPDEFFPSFNPTVIKPEKAFPRSLNFQPLAMVPRDNRLHRRNHLSSEGESFSHVDQKQIYWNSLTFSRFTVRAARGIRSVSCHSVGSPVGEAAGPRSANSAGNDQKSRLPVFRDLQTLPSGKNSFFLKFSYFYLYPHV